METVIKTDFKPRKYIFTVVGSRNIPHEMGVILTKVTSMLSFLGGKLRTGDARGADTYARIALSKGTISDKGIFKEDIEAYTARQGQDSDCLKLAGSFHPFWKTITSDFIKQLHARNVKQIIGMNFDNPIPSDIMICYTPNGIKTHEERVKDFKRTGGTGTAISVAEHFNVPILNIGNEEDYQKVVDFIEKGIPFHPVVEKMLEDYLSSNETITSFNSSNRVFSNFHMFNGMSIQTAFPDMEEPTLNDNVSSYQTVEHAFQAAKTADEFLRIPFTLTCGISPGQAKKLGRELLSIRNDWDLVKLSIMEALLLQKFKMTPYKHMLLWTKDREIREGNYWNDTFWGVDLKTQEGENHLGKLLMKVRDHLKTLEEGNQDA